MIPKRTLGRSGIEVSELALGTWGLSGDGYGAVSASEQDAVIDRALALGVTLVETAASYAKGAMEKRLGERLGDSSDVIVVTKWGTDLGSKPVRKRFDREFLEQSFEGSRERLRRNVLDVGLLHNPSVAAVKNGEAPALLQQWVNDGKLRAWGISAGDADVVKAALELPEPPQVIELAFNIFFQSDLRTLRADLKIKEVGVLARSVLSHGLLAGMWPTDKTFAPEDHRSHRWNPDQLRRRINQTRVLRTLRSGNIPSMRAAAIAYALDHDVISSAVLGPRDVVQVDQLLREVPKQAPYIDPRARETFDTQILKMGIISSLGTG
ncbi:MAG TPA: aldo/keto reductase [Polyangiaceae bacterium]|nr:aldo/keto reductase [Polyangiaceae bacterium]